MLSQWNSQRRMAASGTRSGSPSFRASRTLAPVLSARRATRPAFLGEVPERHAIQLGTCPQGRCRQVQGNAGVALDLREDTEFFERRNVEMKHRCPLFTVGPETLILRDMLAESPHICIDGYQSRGHSSVFAL